MKVTFDDSGFRELMERVKQIRTRAENYEQALKPEAALLHGVIMEGFRTSTSPAGESWPDLADSTIENKGSSRPLVDTGLLRNSVFAAAKGGAVVFGVSGHAAVYAATHQFGRDAIPDRPFLPLDETGTPSFERGRSRTWYEGAQKRIVRWILYDPTDK